MFLLVKTAYKIDYIVFLSNKNKIHKEENNMANNLEIAGAVADILASAATSKKGRKAICGTYSDGTPRSMVDAWRDEYISPKDRERWDKMKKKKKKAKKNAKKNKKKGKKKNSSVVWTYF
jgi:hypothetical protein